MAPKIFLTGVTGYIAGDALCALHKVHPDYEYAALVRTKEKADQVTREYPKVRIVLGGLDDSALLEKESAAADIVLHAADASDHVGAANAIAKGLVSGHSKSRPGYWLHMSGTGILTYKDADAKSYGNHSDEQYDDLDRVEELTGLPDHAFHRDVDKIVLECGARHSDVVKTVVLCPPTIYGKGRGPCATRSRQAYALAKYILTTGKTPIIGAGQARWNNVNVADLSSLYLLLVDAAVKGNDSSELWGPKGYLLAENGEHVWADLSEHMSKIAVGKGYIEKVDKKELSADEALKVAGFEAVTWGLNSRGTARRARKVLGWKPNGKSIEDEAATIVESEYQRLHTK